MTTDATREYTRFSYYFSADPTRSGLLPPEDHVSVDAARRAGSDVPEGYERLPAVELLVATWIEQREGLEAVAKLINRELLDRISGARKEDPDRFPRHGYQYLSIENRRKVHALIRQLASEAR